ncbi:CheB methylesterase domain-containing protein [Campylobacter fetus]|uniref:CheB methylesterase domain-containing protein n=1 Tax=Campylobacter fetus TaxID=196 RepID=UPI000FCAF220|nr:CheB methylesterase domain-containing protein [Campylobacter fetus]QQF51612.1 chemotaxis protein CheB [Campylobacter fetus subsp. venerealis]RUT51182.1 chemotaxis protein CheB [Campylobacter fetus]RUT51909.1 chemotaxis protein CheB [Campylobacter fetus]
MKPKLILIGASTGGPGHLKKLLFDLNLPKNTSVVIAQHMSSMFIHSFVTQFNQDINPDVELLDKKMHLENKVYICEKNSVILNSQTLSANIDESKIVTTFNPNVNMLFNSAVPVCKYVSVMAILLTGIGDDGAVGLDKLYKAGAKCIAENEESAIVYGMPKRAKELNTKLETANLHDIKIKLERFINE